MFEVERSNKFKYGTAKTDGISQVVLSIYKDAEAHHPSRGFMHPVHFSAG